MDKLADRFEIFWLKNEELIKTIIVIIFALVFAWYTVGIRETVLSESMEPTLMTGSRYAAIRTSWLKYFVEPKRGDIQSFVRGKKIIVKRIIGLPGETVTIKDGKVFINGEELEEDYAVGKTYSEKTEFVVPENCYFMLGDNREVSRDSRAWEEPYINKDTFFALTICKII